MSLGTFANATSSPACAAPLLDESLFGTTGGYQAGRYCGYGAFASGAGATSCCLPCPIQDWAYPPGWQAQLCISNYLSIVSLTLCCFLLLSFLVLSAAQSHRHYLNIGLLISVSLVSLSFAIPVTTKPEYCYDAITPLDMHDSMSCAWTGSFITLGGLGCVIWVFLRSLWLFVRVVNNVMPGRRFMLGSIASGTLLPIVFLAAVLPSTGFSYRMGGTCLPNHEAAIATFWVWLALFAALGFVLQAVTIGYCTWIYVRTMKRGHSTSRHDQVYGSTLNKRANVQTWANVMKLLTVRWRNILASIFVLLGSLVFFIVFWTQDIMLDRAFNDPDNIKPVKAWIICQTLSRGDKSKCRDRAMNFVVSKAAVVTSLVFASSIGVVVFILLFRVSMLYAWVALFKRLIERCMHAFSRPVTPEPVSLEKPEANALPSPPLRNSHSRFIESVEAPLVSKPSSNENDTGSSRRSDPLPQTPATPPLPPKPLLHTTHIHDFAQENQPLYPYTSPTSTTPLQPPPLPHRLLSVQTAPPPAPLTSIKMHHYKPLSPSSPTRAHPLNSPRRRPVAQHLRPHSHRPIRIPSTPARSGTYQSSGSAPSPPLRRSTVTGRFGSARVVKKERSWRESTLSALDRVIFEEEEEEEEEEEGDGREGVGENKEVVVGEEGRVDVDGHGDELDGNEVRRMKISGPVEGTFKHVGGAYVGGSEGTMSPFGVEIERAGWSWDGAENGVGNVF